MEDLSLEKKDDLRSNVMESYESKEILARPKCSPSLILIVCISQILPHLTQSVVHRLYFLSTFNFTSAKHPRFNSYFLLL